MQEQGSRALQWKCFLGLVSPDPATWADDAHVRRQYYNHVLEAYADVQLRTVSAACSQAGPGWISRLVLHQGFYCGCDCADSRVSGFACGCCRTRLCSSPPM